MVAERSGISSQEFPSWTGAYMILPTKGEVESNDLYSLMEQELVRILEDEGMRQRYGWDGVKVDGIVAQLGQTSRGEVRDTDHALVRAIRTTERAFVAANVMSDKDMVHRKTGDHVMTHPYWMVLMALHEGWGDLDEAVMMFLHDVAEDTQVGIEEIRASFGDRCAQVVDGLSKAKSQHLLPQDVSAPSPARSLEYKPSQLETNKKMFGTLYDTETSITTESIGSARTVWRIKSYDIRHNLMTIRGHDDFGKQIQKAYLAKNFQVPMMRLLGLEREAAVVEELALEILSGGLRRLWSSDIGLGSQQNGVAARTPEVNILDAAAALEQAAFGSEVLGRMLLPSLEGPRGMLHWRMSNPRVAELVGYLHNAGLRYKVESDPPGPVRIEIAMPIGGVDGQGSTTYPLTIQLDTEEATHTRRSSLEKRLTSAYTRNAPERSGIYALLAETVSGGEVPTFQVMVEGRSAYTLPVGATVADLIYGLYGIDGLVVINALCVRRNGAEQMMDYDQPLREDDVVDTSRITEIQSRHATGVFDANAQILLKLDAVLPPARGGGGAIAELIHLLRKETYWEDTEEIQLERGIRIVAWLYQIMHKEGKKLDLDLIVLGEPDDYRKQLEEIGSILLPACSTEASSLWEQHSKMPASPLHPTIANALKIVDELIKIRESADTVRVRVKNRGGFLLDLGVLLKDLDLSTLPIRAGAVHSADTFGAQAVEIEMVFVGAKQTSITTLEAVLASDDERFADVEVVF